MRYNSFRFIAFFHTLTVSLGNKVPFKIAQRRPNIYALKMSKVSKGQLGTFQPIDTLLYVGQELGVDFLFLSLFSVFSGI